MPPPLRPVALVVDDSPTERRLLAALAEKNGLDVIEAANGESALAAAESRPPDVILLDVHLPDTDGLTLLSQIRTEHPFVPVIVISGSADPDQVEAALDLGAVNFMFKPIKAREVRFILDRIARVLKEEAGLHQALEAVVERQTRMVVRGDPALIPRIVAYLGHEVRSHYPGFDIPLPDIKLALYEALANAVEHGNLEIDFQGKAQAMIDPGGLADLVRSRLADPLLASRKVHVHVLYEPHRVEYRVRDEGRGFDPRGFDEEAALADASALHGRGLALIRHYMDTVTWNDGGTEITMSRELARRQRRADGEDAIDWDVTSLDPG